MQQKIRNKFQELFSTKGSVYASPGRINLIGEHTDYNGGFVFPGAIDKGMIAEIKPNGTGKVRAFQKQAGQDIFSVFAAKPSNVADRSRDSIPCLQAMYLWVQACPLPPHWKVPMHLL